MLGQNILMTLASAALALAATPLESGNWNSVDPSFSVQTCAGGYNSGGYFQIPTSPSGSTSGSGCSNGHLRSERRYNNDYSTGVHQFAGTFNIQSMTGDRIAIKQTFNGNTGPYFILGLQKDGTLYNVEGGQVIATGIKVGQDVVINTVHNADIHRFSVYVNGVERYRDNNAPGGSFYDKLGAYTTNSGTGALGIHWEDVAFWTRA
ncbi:hypothetical protein ESCO_005774 [Escovopsis weberi]|uniref:Uncharacterized protein n=1 Tax=Escovopsis weberi TaxID=150374 RepID=A0A0M8MUY3_ESCWE|nr:hypothetical protein ESCO_005774 [Escovopsis weberi]